MPTYTFLDVCDTAQAEQIQALYTAAGWWTAAADSVDETDLVPRIVAGSHLFCVAKVAGRIIGMGRAISDGASDAYIQDVTVDRGHRGAGIATQIITRVVERLRGDGIGWIGLIAERGTRKLYEPLGFQKMDNSTPMIMLLA